MAEINKVDVGYLRYIGMTRSASGDYTETEVSFVDRSRPYGLQILDNERCYLVKKDELDAYMARKEHLEQMNCTPVFAENQQLKAKVSTLEDANAYLTRLNGHFFKERSKLLEKNEALKDKIERFYGMTSAEDKLRAENEKLKAENEKLKAENKILKKVLSMILSDREEQDS